MTTDSDRQDIDAGFDREAAAELAWRPWKLVSEGRIAEGLAVLDDGGVWWDLSSRSERPMAEMKAALVEMLDIVPISFEFVGSIVEGRRVALMVEGRCQIDENTLYDNVYTLITELDPHRETIVGIREYVDTHHSATVLMPAVFRAVSQRGGNTAIAKLLHNAQ